METDALGAQEVEPGGVAALVERAVGTFDAEQRLLA